MSFGAFVRVENGIEGLVHLSEPADREVQRSDEVVGSVDDGVFVVLLGAALERRRVIPSPRQA